MLLIKQNVLKAFYYLLVFFLITINCSFAQNAKQQIKFGAYYFDGWSGSTNWLLTKTLTDTFSNREPIWGWIANTQTAMDTQIILAKSAGLSFFQFCWYYPDGWHANPQKHPLNHALKLYIESKKRKGFNFSLMIANHDGNYIYPQDWETVTDIWISMFKDSQYVTVAGKPFITFFDVKALVDKFGSSFAVKKAFDVFRNKTKTNGLLGVSIAACVDTSQKMIDLAQDCGFDILTGYNYHEAGFSAKPQPTPITQLQSGEISFWDKIARCTNLNYVPTCTLNWDPRPWIVNTKWYASSGYFNGYSATSVYNSITNCIKWMGKQKKHITREKLFLIYAWNENGEGAWLTPNKNGINLLSGVKLAIEKWDSQKK